MGWQINFIDKQVKLSNPIFISGLPGIGNVSKIAVDFIIEEVKAKKMLELHSYNLPHSVFVNDQNLIEMPSIAIHHKKIKNQDYLFLAGDAQPTDEPSTYELCDTILDYLQKQNCKEIVCLAGIGLQNEPKKPKVYCTGNNKNIVQMYKKELKLNNNISAVVGPIIGTAGLLPGLAIRKNMPAIILLSETFAHPLYVGIKGAKELTKVLKKV